MMSDLFYSHVMIFILNRNADNFKFKIKNLKFNINSVYGQLATGNKNDHRRMAKTK